MLMKIGDYRVGERAKDLVKQMTLEEKAGMLLIHSQFSAVSQKDETLTSMNGKLNEAEASSETKIYLNYSGNTKTIKDLNIRHIITREFIKAEEIAQWNNAMNELAESTRLGIPVQITSNPKNSSDMLLADFKNSNNTIYPSTLGIAAASLGEEKAKGSSKIVEEFAEIVKKEFMASGIRKGYMYSADVMTDTRWARNSETFGENVDFVSKAIQTIVETLQSGKKLKADSVALTVKHFPGSGARNNGNDSHYEAGRYSPYKTENSLEKYHLKPFEAAINAGVSSIMPYYSQPDPNSAKQTYQNENIAMGGSSYTYNQEFLNNLLREKMQFKGYINTDSGVIDFISWGEENKTNSEKVAKAINSGVDLISDTNHVEWVIEAVKQGLLTEEKVNEAVERVAIEMFEQGLFENPYVEAEKAKDIVATQENIDKAYEVHQKSVVLLKNQEEALPIKPKNEQENIKVYVEEYGTTGRMIADALATRQYPIQIVEDYQQADYFITYLSGKTTKETVWDLNLKDMIGEKYEAWMATGNQIKQNGGKRITIVNFNTAFILDGIEQYSDAILGGFRTYTCAIMDVMTGKVQATGVLPFTLPANSDVVAIDEKGECASPNDVPGYDKTQYMKDNKVYEYIDQQGNKYVCGFGLNEK